MTPQLRSADVLDRTRAEGRAALVGYLPVGFPSVAGSIEAARVLLDSGADVLELGLPYSDPVMDGPVIQHAATVALANGTRTADVLRAVEELADGQGAVLVMSYYNPIVAYGPEAFARDLAAAGGAGLITPDLIPDEAQEWIAASEQHSLDRVFLVAPSSPRQRLEYVAAQCRGFVYAASTMGVTGTRASVGEAAEGLVARTRAAGAQRVCVGLGVSTPEQAAEVASYADGVIVGSAFVRALTEAEDMAHARRALERTARALREGIDSAGRPERGGPQSSAPEHSDTGA